MSEQYETKVVFYKNQGKMQRGIKQMEKAGWQVVDTEAVEQGYSGCKTCLFGCLYLPMALLGRKSAQYKVQYRRPKQ